MAACHRKRKGSLVNKILHIHNSRSPTHRSVPRHIRTFATRQYQIPQLLLTDSAVEGLEAAHLRRLLRLLRLLTELVLCRLHVLRKG